MSYNYMVPYYLFWPIAFISFVSVFFLPTNTKVTLNENYDINITNYTNNNINYIFLLKSKNGKNITETCKNFLNDVNNQKEIYLINKFNLTIKITVIILFGITVLSIGLVVYTEHIGLFDDYIFDNFFEKWEHCYSCKSLYGSYSGMSSKFFRVLSIFIIICLGIIFLSAFSIYFSIEVKDKMTIYCGFELGEDYNIDLWITSKAFLGIIIFLYCFEISLCVFSICFGIAQFIKERRKINI